MRATCKAAQRCRQRSLPVEAALKVRTVGNDSPWIVPEARTRSRKNSCSARAGSQTSRTPPRSRRRCATPRAYRRVCRMGRLGGGVGRGARSYDRTGGDLEDRVRAPPMRTAALPGVHFSTAIGRIATWCFCGAGAPARAKAAFASFSKTICISMQTSRLLQRRTAACRSSAACVNNAYPNRDSSPR